MNNTFVVAVTCPNCGGKLTASSHNLSVKCHWCHTIIPADLFVENPKMPDRILTFSITKEEAIKKIDEYIKERKEYAKKEFIDNYNINEVIPVYLPYMLVDVKAHSTNNGMAEKKLVDPHGERKKGKYYISISKVKREFDISIDDLLIESSKSNTFDRINTTSNIISAVSPFDTKNSVEFNVNFLNGFAAENRDLDIEYLTGQIPPVLDEIIEHECDKMGEEYDRALDWNEHKNDILHTKWSSSLLPIWLYSYIERTDEGTKTYYIAVNGRTGKTVGSIPFEEKKVRKDLRIKISIPYFIISIALAVICALLILSYGEFPSEFLTQLIIGHCLTLGALYFILFCFYTFKYHEKYDSLKKLYTGSNQKIDHINDTSYHIDNINKGDEVIREEWTNLYKTKKQKNAVKMTMIVSDKNE